MKLLAGFRRDETGFHMLQEFVEEYGKIFVIWVGIKPMVIVCDPEAVKSTVYDNIHPKEHKRPEAFLFGERFCGAGSIFTNPGNNYWKESRVLFNKFFRKSFLHEYIKSVNLVGERLVERLRSECDGVIDLDHWFNLAACDVIGLVAFNWDIDSVSSSDPKFTKYLNDALFGCTFAGLPWARVAPWKAKERGMARSAVKALREHCKERLRKRGDEGRSIDDLLTGKPPHHSLL